jgi:hypothetical protein
MFVEKLLGKLEKLLGGDAIESRWYEAELREFTLHKEVSDITVEGHGWLWKNGDAIVYKLTDDGWAKATVYPMDSSNQAMKAVVGSSSGFEEVCRESGVESVSSSEIGVTEWDIDVDVADGTICSVERETILRS